MPDLKQFTRVVSEHHVSLRYFIAGLGVNPAWVDDVAQDAFLIAYRKWSEFETVENPGAWLRTIARNVVLNETAKLNRRRRLLDENLTTLMLDSEDSAPAAGELADLSRRHEALRVCLGRLSERARRVVEARYFKERNSSQIGGDLSMTPTAVRKLLFHSRRALGECLKEEVPDVS